MLSIVIPTYNRNDLLEKCLDCLKVSLDNFDRTSVEVIVTDDSPNTGAKSFLEASYEWVKWKAGPKKGPASNRNSGANHAQYEWLIFLDDDCLPTPGLINAYYDEIIKGEFKALEGAINVDRPQERYDEQSPINLKGDSFWSCNICVAKSLFNTVGGFDEKFPYPAMEDVDFHIRVKALAPIKFLKDALVIHPWRKAGVFTTYKKQMASYDYFDRKYANREKKNYRLHTIKTLFLFATSNFKSLTKFSFRGYKYYLEMVYVHTLMIFR
jgi:glycosyltransferase involved in cell wall biosynthesis